MDWLIVKAYHFRPDLQEAEDSWQKDLHTMLEVQQKVKTSRTKDVQQKKGYIMSLPITQEKM